MYICVYIHSCAINGAENPLWGLLKDHANMEIALRRMELKDPLHSQVPQEGDTASHAGLHMGEAPRGWLSHAGGGAEREREREDPRAGAFTGRQSGTHCKVMRSCIGVLECHRFTVRGAQGRDQAYHTSVADGLCRTLTAHSWGCGGTRKIGGLQRSLVLQWVGNLGLLWCRFDPWSRNFPLLWVWPQKWTVQLPARSLSTGQWWCCED